jgi:peptidoglycan/xylan/chitin deacetylase (PgdA/CDA1 family)
MSHRDLRRLEGVELARELGRSKAAIEELTGRPCRTFAYPFGLLDERVGRPMERAGYELAFAWLPGPRRRLEASRLPSPIRHGGWTLALKMRGLRRPGWLAP